jgi:hypothetical protein
VQQIFHEEFVVATFKTRECNKVGMSLGDRNR